LFRKEKVDQDRNEELGAYLEMAAEEKMKDGMSHKNASRAVRICAARMLRTSRMIR
jgi:hypothetical protein